MTPRNVTCHPLSRYIPLSIDHASVFVISEGIVMPWPCHRHRSLARAAFLASDPSYTCPAS